jgi:arsenate reductase
MKKVLFACVENSCRSQMAEGFANIHGTNVLMPFSAGSKASGEINDKAVIAMKEIGYDLTEHKSKGLDEFSDIKFDYLITLGCNEKCPNIETKLRKEWDIPDPKNMNLEDFFKVRDLIEKKVLSLIDEIGQ